VATTADDQTIIGCMVGATVLTYTAKVVGKHEVTIRPLIGMFVGTSLLLAVGMWSPEVSQGFAVVALVTSAILNGAEVFGAVGFLSTGKK
jgi:hypothetical protein